MAGVEVEAGAVRDGCLWCLVHSVRYRSRFRARGRGAVLTVGCRRESPVEAMVRSWSASSGVVDGRTRCSSSRLTVSVGILVGTRRLPHAWIGAVHRTRSRSSEVVLAQVIVMRGAGLRVNWFCRCFDVCGLTVAIAALKFDREWCILLRAHLSRRWGSVRIRVIYSVAGRMIVPIAIHMVVPITLRMIISVTIRADISVTVHVVVSVIVHMIIPVAVAIAVSVIVYVVVSVAVEISLGVIAVGMVKGRVRIWRYMTPLVRALIASEMRALVAWTLTIWALSSRQRALVSWTLTIGTLSSREWTHTLGWSVIHHTRLLLRNRRLLKIIHFQLFLVDQDLLGGRSLPAGHRRQRILSGSLLTSLEFGKLGHSSVVGARRKWRNPGVHGRF